MAIKSVPNEFSTGATISASEHNDNFTTIYDDYGGNIQNVNIAAAAAITDGKLAQITTASKVSGAALTSLASIPAGAGAIPLANLTNILPSGVIVMWSGTIATIPTGFVLCDGNNSTPDLTNRFVVCADADDSGAAKSTITGSALVSHDTGIMPEHSHTFNVRDSYGSSTHPSRGSTGTNGGSTDTSGTGTKVIAVFYALAYIMKT